ncbi:aldo/keto reductase [Bacteroidia bacterium]|nr:aldo/keto reductase [Bacteroidia bacterium]
MKKIQLSNTGWEVSNVVMGCMRLCQLSKSEAGQLINAALESGINFFDHADIYGKTECERLFAEAFPMNNSQREKIFIQSKCGIRNGYYDFSKEYILEAVDGILSRLKTSYLDVLLLHRPDALMEPYEIAEAFDRLLLCGKVRAFGVSNCNPMQIELLQRALPNKLIINQLQFSIAHSLLVDGGIAVNMGSAQSVDRTGSALDYCRLHNITIQAWSPFQKGFFEGVFLGDKSYAELNVVIDRLAAKYGVTNTAIAVAWITRHPANLQVVLGTTNVQRLRDSCAGSNIALQRQEWYEIYKAAGNIIP